MNKTVKTSLIIIGVLGAIIVITYFSINSTKANPPDIPDLPDYNKEYKYCCPKPCGSPANKCYKRADDNKLKCPPTGTGLENANDYKYGCNSNKKESFSLSSGAITIIVIASILLFVLFIWAIKK